MACSVPAPGRRDWPSDRHCISTSSKSIHRTILVPQPPRCPFKYVPTPIGDFMEKIRGHDSAIYEHCPFRADGFARALGCDCRSLRPPPPRHSPRDAAHPPLPCCLRVRERLVARDLGDEDGDAPLDVAAGACAPMDGPDLGGNGIVVVRGVDQGQAGPHSGPRTGDEGTGLPAADPLPLSGPMCPSPQSPYNPHWMIWASWRSVTCPLDE